MSLAAVFVCFRELLLLFVSLLLATSYCYAMSVVVYCDVKPGIAKCYYYKKDFLVIFLDFFTSFYRAACNADVV